MLATREPRSDKLVEFLEYEDRRITCVDCSDEFVWTAGEQAFFHDKGLVNDPKRCPPCKVHKRNRMAALEAGVTQKKVEVAVRCARCGERTTVPFYPSQGRPVYCRSCFQTAGGSRQ
jgi:CxxC-x17-CxxC domain-containing protein